MTKSIGITGGIGSGKTTVCKIFESMGIPIYYADERAKALMSEKMHLIEGILDVFGVEAYHSDGTLHRAHIAKIAFSNKKKLAKLNALVHPAVGLDYQKWFEAQKAQKPSPAYAIKEAALMIETGGYKEMDALIVVTAPEALRIERVVQRDGSNTAAVQARIANQIQETERLRHANFVINNDANQQLIPQVVAIHRALSGT